MRAATVRAVKTVLPPRALRSMQTYYDRLRLWQQIGRDVRGVGFADKLSLGASLIASPFTSLAGLSQWRDPLLLSRAQVEVKGVGRFELRARTDDLLHVVPGREPAVMEALVRHLAPGDCFVDAGANIGIFSVLGAKLVGSQGNVVAIEMLPGTAEALRKHVALNGVPWVRVVEEALSNVEGEVVTAYVPEGYFGRASLGSPAGDANRVQVTTTTLDAVLRDVDKVQLLKLDIEGAELLALEGAREVLDRVHTVIFEHLTPEAHTAVTALLSTAGFDVRRLTDRESIAVRPAAVAAGDNR